MIEKDALKVGLETEDNVQLYAYKEGIKGSKLHGGILTKHKVISIEVTMFWPSATSSSLSYLTSRLSANLDHMQILRMRNVR